MKQKATCSQVTLEKIQESVQHKQEKSNIVVIQSPTRLDKDIDKGKGADLTIG